MLTREGIINILFVFGFITTILVTLAFAYSLTGGITGLLAILGIVQMVWKI